MTRELVFLILYLLIIQIFFFYSVSYVFISQGKFGWMWIKSRIMAVRTFFVKCIDFTKSTFS